MPGDRSPLGGYENPYPPRGPQPRRRSRGRDGDLLTAGQRRRDTRRARRLLHAGVGRVLVVGSAEQYGAVEPDDAPDRRATPCRPISPYGESKVAAERSRSPRTATTGSPSSAPARSTTPDRASRPTFLVPGLAARIAAAEREGPTRSCSATVTPCATSATCATSCARTRCWSSTVSPGEAYNVCSGRGVRVGDLAADLVARATRPLRIVDRTANSCARSTCPCSSAIPPSSSPPPAGSAEYTLDDTLDAVLEAARAAG